jgi:hypothetical protein
MRRTMMLILTTGLFAGTGGAAELYTLCERPDDAPNTLYVGNRAPLLPSPLVKLPIGAVTPQGWLRTQLDLESEGFSGRLTEISEFLAKDGNGWLSTSGEGGHGWEEVPYWLKGFGDLGYVLNNPRIISEAKIWIEGALAGQRADGYFGPRSNLTSIKGKPDLWPHMIMLNALQSYYEFSGDRRILDFMTRFFKWELAVPDADFLIPFWQHQRASDNLASVYWLYNRTGDAFLLELGEKINRCGARWDERVTSWHGVNIGQGFRAPGIYYQQSKNPKHLQAAWDRYNDVMSVYGQVPGGGFGSDENCRPTFVGPRQGTETCTWAELMLSFEMLMKIDGDRRWADLCEEIAFNSLPASMTADLKGLRYLTAPNHVISDRKNHAPAIENGGDMLSFNPHSFRCCQHNVAHAWPYFAESLWMATPGNGLAAVMYAASQVKAQVGDGVAATITEETRYPFEETIRIKVSVARPVQFPLYLRVPGWSGTPVVKLNGVAAPASTGQGAYVRIARQWQDGDTVELTLPARVTVRTWAKNDNSISVARGPLTYALKIGERYEQYEGTKKAALTAQWPAFEVLPTTPWNYGLVVDRAAPDQSLTLVDKHWNGQGQPFTLDAAPLELRAKARPIENWKLDERFGLVGNLQPSPVRSGAPEEAVTLVPMGCARLRIASFPAIGAGPDAHEWIDKTSGAVGSHYFDDIDALNDGKLPANSNDHSIPRFTWWDHKGTTEFVQYNFTEFRKLSAAGVYWFDDTPGGGCKVPRSWRILYQVKAREMTAGEWAPVELLGGEYGCQPNQMNSIKFKPVETRGLRLEVQLQPDFSGGVLEWKVE